MRFEDQEGNDDERKRNDCRGIGGRNVDDTGTVDTQKLDVAPGEIETEQ